MSAHPDLSSPWARLAVVGLLSRPGDDRFLLLRRVPDGVWGPPGGRLEHGEGLEDALVREVAEETSLNIEVAGICYAYDGVHKGERVVAVSFACRTTEAEPGDPVPAAEEADAWRWVTPAEWVALAHDGLTPWRRDDIVKATALARHLWIVHGQSIGGSTAGREAAAAD